MGHTKASLIHQAVIPRSTFYDSPFGRMFGKLPPWESPESVDSAAESALRDFATSSMSEAQDEPEPDNVNLPAGYTYFGQFVDHDITFDPTSSLQRQNDPNKLKNFRTPRLDLDCIYGSGPSDQPFMYSNFRKGMLLVGVVGNTMEPDLPRNVEGRAIIGDMRNDENLIVSQIQLGMILLHNRVYTALLGLDPLNLPEEFKLDMRVFREAQRVVRWFYQFVVWNDFVKRLVKNTLWERVLQKRDGIFHYNGNFYRWKHDPYIPVEFSVAAYRFGHSLIRPGYQINLNTDVGLGFGVEKPIFNPDGSRTNDLRGFGPRPTRHTLQWDWFFEFQSSTGPFPQPSRKIDPKLSSAVFALDEGPDPQPNMLAFLNLLRSMRMSLPSGTTVAKAMGFKPLMLGADPHEDVLWHYILKESSQMDGADKGKMLGNVGGTIVAEVFAGLLKGDPLSYVNVHPAWTPADESVLPFDVPENGANWGVADLLKAAGMPASADDVENFINNGRV